MSLKGLLLPRDCSACFYIYLIWNHSIMYRNTSQIKALLTTQYYPKIRHILDCVDYCDDDDESFLTFLSGN